MEKEDLCAITIKLDALRSALSENQKTEVDSLIKSASNKLISSGRYNEVQQSIFAEYLEWRH